MEEKIKISPISISINDSGKYVTRSDEVVKEELLDIFSDYLYSLNKYIYACYDEMYSMCNGSIFNILFFAYDKKLFLCRAFPSLKAGTVVNEMEGITFDLKDIDRVWFYLPELVGFIYDNMYKTQIAEKYITFTMIEKYEKNWDCYDIVQKIIESEYPYNFSISPVKIHVNNMKFISVDDTYIEKGSDKILGIDEILNLRCIKEKQFNITARLQYELPSFDQKNSRDKNERVKNKILNKIDERRKVRQQIKEGVVDWYILDDDKQVHLNRITQEGQLRFSDILDKLDFE